MDQLVDLYALRYGTKDPDIVDYHTALMTTTLMIVEVSGDIFLTLS